MNQPDILEKFVNPFYEPNPDIIWPSVAPISIELWRELYQGHTAAVPWDGLLACVVELKERHQSIKRSATELHETIRQVLEEADLLSDDNSSSSVSAASCSHKNTDLRGNEEEIHRRLTQLSMEQAQNT